MTALGCWHLFQCCTSPKLVYMPRWKRYLEKLAKADTTANKFCGRTSSDSAGFLFKFTNPFSQSLLQHFFLCSSSFSTPKTSWIFTLLQKYKTSIALNLLFPNLNLKLSFVYWKTVLSILCLTFLHLHLSLLLSQELWILIYVKDFRCLA